RYIIDLMKKFELCYTIDETRILIPDLLAVGEPEIPLDLTNVLRFRVCYNFLPKSVMARFIVRRHLDIKDELQWRSGVVLKNKGFDATAVVKSDQREKTIHIVVTGTQKREYLAIILNTFREINRSFEKIEVDECIPLPANPKVAVSYMHLVRLEKMGQIDFLPQGAENIYNVKALLDGIKPEKERRKEVESLLREGGLTINVQQNQDVRQEVHVEVNLSVELPALQEGFEELKELLVQLKPGSKEKLEKVGTALDALSPKSDREKLNGALNKLGRFLKKVGDEDSDYNKVLSGAQKGVDTLKKVGRTYNKIAQWLALPQVPDFFLKE
ncbi:MAG: hypothetical protein GY950_02500, partial [bacterium]|nr:hypothetical protein [bacterium]